MAYSLSVRYRRILWTGLILFVLGVVFVTGANFWIVQRARKAVVSQVDKLPENDVALVLGTAPNVGKWRNLFFEARMDAAARLYHEGKARHLLVSGDNGRKEYDEPTWMREALVARGVPESAITLDYAGFRTLDSMARAKAVFGLQRCTIVTDDFHQARAIFLARAHGLEAVGFRAKPVPLRWSMRTRVREIASRAAACLDVYVLRTKPRFYGPRVEIPIAAQS
jgi:SanA protein